MGSTNGTIVENEFIELKEFDNLEKFHSTEQEDKLEHWDWDINGIKYDVKSQKKRKRCDDSVSNEHTYVEFVTYGHRGWIYGKADKIAFEFCDSFIIVDRERLLKLVSDNMTNADVFDRPMEYTYYKRKRKGSYDLLVLTPIHDIAEISEKIIQKD
jgi:hypothetical protein